MPTATSAIPRFKVTMTDFGRLTELLIDGKPAPAWLIAALQEETLMQYLTPEELSDSVRSAVARVTADVMHFKLIP